MGENGGLLRKFIWGKDAPEAFIPATKGQERMRALRAGRTKAVLEHNELVLLEEITRLRKALTRIAEMAQRSEAHPDLQFGPIALEALETEYVGREHLCPDCLVERADYEGTDMHLSTCPNCGSERLPVTAHKATSDTGSDS